MLVCEVLLQCSCDGGLGRQLKLSSVVPGQPGALCQCHGFLSPCFKSVNLKIIVICFKVGKTFDILSFWRSS